jgi:apolipoprotein D and lipocalin family protein
MKILLQPYYSIRFFRNNVQRIISGKFNLTGQKKDGRFNIHYDTLIPYDASLVVLDTDYDNYAVMWSCSNIGPVGHTESVWVLTRERVPPGPVLQSAYGVLDKFKISRTFFVQTDQTDCVTLPPPIEAIDPTENTVKSIPELILDQTKSNEAFVTTSSSVEVDNPNDPSNQP